jgi:hypothetical protein
MDEEKKSWRKTTLSTLSLMPFVPSMAESLRIIQVRREKPKPLEEVSSINKLEESLDKKLKTTPQFSKTWKTNSMSVSVAKANVIHETSDGVSTFEKQSPKLILGRQRRVFYAYLLTGLIIFIASIGVGLAVGLNEKKTAEAAQAQAPQLAAALTYPGLAVSGIVVKNVTQWNMQLFYQDPVTNSINYRISTNTIDYSTPQFITLNRAPTNNISLTATSFEGSDGETFHQLLYMMDGNISFANLTCPPTAPTTCSTLTNTILPTGDLNRVANGSTIAAVFLGLGPNKGWKVFYHNIKYQLTVVANIDGVWDLEWTVIGSTAVRGSGIAATMFSAPNFVEVLYVDAASGSIYAAENMGGQWIGRKTPSPPYQGYSNTDMERASPISSVPSLALLPTPSLAISYAFTPDNFHAYYTGSDSEIYEYVGVGVSSSFFPAAISSNSTGKSTRGWTSTPDHNQTWASSEGPGAPVVSTGWSDQIRFFQMLGGDVVSSAFNSTSGVWQAPLRL